MTIRLLSLTLAFILVTGTATGQSHRESGPSLNTSEEQSNTTKPHSAQSLISGKIISSDQEIMDFATIQIKGTSIGVRPDKQGFYHLKTKAGTHTLIFSAMGYTTTEHTVHVKAGERLKLNVTMTPQDIQLDEIQVEASHAQRINRSAFNATAIDLKPMAGLNKNLAEVLTAAPGVKLRESGGMGSDMQLSLDGFSGKHVKIFIDGIPQEGAGTALNLNNLPVNFAERIEVYRGVVPVGFGTDALGGVINIVTPQRKPGWFADASYSYGSFNTHKSSVNFGQTLDNGLLYEITAFQNFSDNSYAIDNYITEFSDDGITENTDKSKIYHVKRFNDQFHNEALTGKIGIANKKWTDKLTLGLTYTHFYKEIQNGVRQEIVFGEKHRKGYSFVPSLEYRKRHFLTEGLDVTASINYNHNITHNIDTASYKYNWLGDKKYTGTPGEQSNQNNESKNRNWNGTFTASYRIGNAHLFSLNHVLSTFNRTTRSYVSGSSRLSDFSIPKRSRKNVTGLGYRFMPSEKWNVTAFGKYYLQYNEGPVSQSDDGIGNYIKMNRHTSALGYGTAGTYFILKNLQAKLSYEKAYRLPTTDELFGDEDMEAGKTDLRPEKSDNFNFNLSYDPTFGKHGIHLDGSLIYRNTKDYIRRGLDKVGNLNFGIYENHGKVLTKGYNISVRYHYSRWLSIGGTFNSMDARDNEKTIAAGTQQSALTYKQRIPNQPYRYANMDATFNWYGLFGKDNVLSFTYDSYYQHEFPLYWEEFGDPETKMRVPTQFSHNITLNYSIQKGRYNFSLECRNLTDEKLYDNFSLQKAGRAFYGKIRICFGS